MLGCDQHQNLGERARGKSVSWGVLAGGLALGWALLSSELGLSQRLGWLIALPAFASAYLLISGTLGVCAFNSMTGDRRVDYGREAVLDPHTRAQLKLRALAAVFASLLIACGFAVALMASS